jgi:hypothetical protein
MLRHLKAITLSISVFALSLNAQFDDSTNSLCYTQKFKPTFDFKSTVIDTCANSIEIKVNYQGKPFYAYWSDGETSINRTVYYSGQYQLALFDSLKCIDTSVTLDIKLTGGTIYVYTQNGTNEVTLCSGNSVTLYAYHDQQIEWNTGETTSYIYVEKGGKYYAKSKNNATCVITSDTITVTEVSTKIASVSITGDSIFCMGDSAILEVDLTDTNVYWYPYYDFGKKITAKYPGVYYVYTKDPTYGCDVKSQQITIQVKTPEPFVLCMVTNDSATGKNKLVWESKPWVTKYHVYRETNISGEFELLGELEGAGQDHFLDTSSKPRTRPYTYYIHAFDSCGNASEENTYYRHTTLHLTANLGVSGENNLNWSSYYGIYPIISYNIYRSNNDEPYKKIASVSSTVNSYSDFDPPSGTNRYHIAIDADLNCNSSQETALVSNMVAFGILSDEKMNGSAFSLHPNPATNTFVINGLPENTPVSLYTITGVFLGRLTPNANQNYDITNLNAGMYFVEIGKGRTVKLIKN